MENEKTLLTPEEVEKRRRQPAEEKRPSDTKDSPEDKFYNHGEMVVVNYETMGRFDFPAIGYFRDFSIEDTNNLMMSRREDLLETLISILNTIKSPEITADVGDMLSEEFLETLVAIKAQFNTTEHIHPWICTCQEESEDADVQVNEELVNLKDIQYMSIEEADKKMQEAYLERFKQMSDEEFRTHLFKRYKDNPIVDMDAHTREVEAGKTKIKEPIFFNYADTQYGFRLTRIKDVVRAQKIVDEKYAGKIKAIQSRREPAGASLADVKLRKEKEIEEIKRCQKKDLSLYVRALSLVQKDGRDITDVQEKIEIYKKLPRSFLLEMISFMDELRFGIQDEKEIVCPLCGRTDKRLLQRQLMYLELLPLDTDTKRIGRVNAGVNIYFGV